MYKHTPADYVVFWLLVLAGLGYLTGLALVIKYL